MAESILTIQIDSFFSFMCVCVFWCVRQYVSAVSRLGEAWSFLESQTNSIILGSLAWAREGLPMVTFHTKPGMLSTVAYC